MGWEHYFPYMNKKAKYLAALNAGMNKGEAARLAGVTTSTTHRWAAEDAVYRLKVNIAIGSAKVAAVARFEEFLEAMRHDSP